MKVKDLASELGQSVKPFIRFLEEVDIKVKTGNTRLDDDMVETIKELFEGQKEDALVEEVEEGEKELTIKVNDSEPLTVGLLADKLNLKHAETDSRRAVASFLFRFQKAELRHPVRVFESVACSSPRTLHLF